jgi:methylenetetrahydrofolate reductase (NADPH)
MVEALKQHFALTVEVMPPRGPEAGPILQALATLGELPIDAYTVPTNPLARPYLSSLALCALVGRATGREAVLHCTTRDHNRISLQSLLWGARALGITTVLAATGDTVGVSDSGRITPVHDLEVFELVRMAAASGLEAGVVLDPRLESGGLEREVERLYRKAEAGARFVITQPVYEVAFAETLARALEPVGLPVLLGIMPLWSHRHAEFLHREVSGIVVPEALRRRMQAAQDPRREGLAAARLMFEAARGLFAGVCLMPPFNHYELLQELLR